MVQLSLAPVVNEKLFSKHFLEERIKGLSEWQEDERAKIAYEKIKKIYEGKKEVIVTYTDNEAQLEMDFIRPALKALGHIFGVQAMVQQSAKRPDYAFFDNEGDKTEAFKNKDSDDFYKKAIAVGDAKAWDKNLDKKIGGKDIFENQNPSHQIDFYLRETPPDWGVLTNGRKWRLYFEEVSHRLDTYYEVDLVNILEKDDFESFKYFYLFFRKEAFIPVGDSFLDNIYNQSVRFAEEIGESLEDNVYSALLWMAKGYFNMKTNQLEKNEENVKKVHENSLIFLYRLLFLLYAESKGMLGTEVPRKYANQYSFTKWVDDILNDIDNGNVNPRGGLYNFRLMWIFRLVREGSEALGIPKEEFYVPAYNGDLFDNEKHPLLRAKKIQDGHLARVVDLLVRAPSKEQEGRGKIDYSDLSLRHLGGIYEGLLEYKPKLANQDMVAVKTKGALKWIPASEAEKDFSEFGADKRAEQGELYLATDRGERKATGSYYTPDYIVKYIVENTVGPAVEEKLKDAETEEEKIDAILSMKVLDPAMGSGHFLVETVDFLASKLAEITKGEEKERDIDWAKRKVARNCIYGVDLNSLATELAKVSLWLNTMAEDKPLSFLDHHLKTGNSLIGADIHKIDRHPKEVESVSEEKRKIGQLALSDFFGKSVRDDIKQLLGVYREILEVTEEKPEDIKEQEELFQKFEAHPFKKRFDVLSDVHTSYYFGNKFSKSQYERLLEAFRSGSDQKWNEILQEDWVRKASDSVPKELKLEDNLSDQKRFFHWKLEFPEVFFDVQKGGGKENPGFDVVVGNPPWGELQQDSEKNYFKEIFDILKKGKVDIYPLFVTSSISLTKKSGFYGGIVPNTLLFNPHHQPIRKFILKESSISIVYNLSKYIFEDAPDTVPAILVCSKQKKKTNIVLVKQLVEKTGLYGLKTRKNEIDSKIDQSIFEKEKTNKFNPRLCLHTRHIFERLTETSQKLREFCIASQGIKPYATKEEKNKHQYLSFNTTGNNWIPALRGRNIERYAQNWEGEYVLYGEWLYSRPREEFENAECIFYQRLRKASLFPRLVACLANTGKVKPLAACSVVTTKKETEIDIKFILTLINSRLINEWYRAFDTDVEIKIESFLSIPIRRISFTTPKSERKRLLNNAVKLYQKEDGSEVLELVDECLPRDKDGSFIATKEKSDVVHDILAYLAEHMVEMNKQRREETKGFLSWLEREIGISIDNISNKTAIKEYHENTFDKFIEILKKNRKKLSIDPSRRTFQEKLKKEFDSSAAKLTPLKAKIRATDELIDQIVYKLYGLTDAEIKIVEESFQ